MQSLICPVSPLRVNNSAVRITGLMMALMLMLYIYTGNIYFVVAITLDYAVRAFTPLQYSPFSLMAQLLAGALKLPVYLIDKAPKIFAARVGFLFALATVILYFINPSATFITPSVITGLVLMAFATLESVFDLCMGCIVYTYVVLPLFHR